MVYKSHWLHFNRYHSNIQEQASKETISKMLPKQCLIRSTLFAVMFATIFILTAATTDNSTMDSTTMDTESPTTSSITTNGISDDGVVTTIATNTVDVTNVSTTDAPTTCNKLTYTYQGRHMISSLLEDKLDSNFFVRITCTDACDKTETVSTGCKEPSEFRVRHCIIEWKHNDPESEVCFCVLKEPLKECTGQLVQKVSGMERDLLKPFPVKILKNSGRHGRSQQPTLTFVSQ